ncbi:hypothetical protein CISIN_1g040118mg [Citrus sinensis]|uniref:Uncharacterized protein n=1 Tax=Citrus sinensis TaxID=2711 RepID=A0A067F3A7_CITSI|nr:hypothetical protein CISIN_1g040118mg [Citrus sinensis]
MININKRTITHIAATKSCFPWRTLYNNCLPILRHRELVEWCRMAMIITLIQYLQSFIQPIPCYRKS